MKLPETITILVRPNGKVEVETHGMTGESCADVSAYLEKLLAGDDPEAGDVQRELKAEYYLPDTEQLEVEERAG